MIYASYTTYILLDLFRSTRHGLMTCEIKWWTELERTYILKLLNYKSKCHAYYAKYMSTQFYKRACFVFQNCIKRWHVDIIKRSILLNEQPEGSPKLCRSVYFHPQQIITWPKRCTACTYIGLFHDVKPLVGIDHFCIVLLVLARPWNK